MPDEQETIDSPELEAPAGEASQDDNLTELDTEGQEEDGTDEGQAPEIEYAEVEINGKTYQLHPDLKDRVWLDTDYTTKSQANSELRKSLEAKQAEIDRAYQASEEFLEAKAAIKNIDSQLKQYENVNWNALEQDDPMAAMSHWRQYQQLQQQRGQVAQYLDKTQTELSEKAAQDTDKRLRETRAFAEKDIPGWTPEMDGKILEFTQSMGIDKTALQQSMNPQVYKILHHAWIGHQALQKQAAAPKPAVQQATQPLTKITARANPPVTGLDDRLSQDEWLKRRNAQLSKRG